MTIFRIDPWLIGPAVTNRFAGPIADAVKRTPAGKGELKRRNPSDQLSPPVSRQTAR